MTPEEYTQLSPAGRRKYHGRVWAGYLAAERGCHRGDPQYGAVLAECIAEAEADPDLDAAIACADAAPPFDPGTARQIRRLLREAARKDGAS